MDEVTVSVTVRGQESMRVEQTGHQRVMDELGRVVLPLDLRRQLEMEPLDKLDVGIDKKLRAIILTKSGAKMGLPANTLSEVSGTPPQSDDGENTQNEESIHTASND